MTRAFIAISTTQRIPLPALASAIGMYFAARLCITYLFFQSDPQLGAIAGFALNMFTLVAVSFHAIGAPASAKLALFSIPCMRWVFAFLTLCLTSLLWSETVSLSIAVGYWCGIAADVVMVVLLLRSNPIEEAATGLLQGYVCGACLIACVMWLSPTMQDLRLGNDEFFSPNAVAFIMAFGIFCALLLMQRKRATLWSGAFLFISLLRSLSKTTIIAFLASQLCILMLDRTISRRSKLLFLTAGSLVLAAFSPLISAYYVVYTNAGNQAETLTGRIGIWAFVLERSLERPWLGHGFHSFRNVIPPFGDFEAWHAHNEILQQFYTYGVMGLLMLAGIYASFASFARRIADPAQRAWFFSLLLFILIRGLGDTDRFELSLPFWSIALFTLYSSALRAQGTA